MTNVTNQKKPGDQLFLSQDKPRPEHIAFNVADPAGIASWYCDHLGMKVVRKGPPPANAHFIADFAGNMMLEVFHDHGYPLHDLSSIHHMSFHVAFIVNDVVSMRNRLIDAGAQLVEDVKVNENGDQVLMLRDPWGVAIQFVRRAEPMLK